jgi:hypothetical protein
VNRIAYASLTVATTSLLAVPCGCGSDDQPTDPPPPTVVPSASAGHSLVYANDLQRVLLVNAGLGGMDTPPASTPTRVWAWDGQRWAVLDSAGPPVRNLAGVAYDTRRHVLVMHGGTYDLGRSYAETWEWSSASGWHRSTATGPGIRDHTQMAYDAARERMVLFGGQESPDAAFGDTWEYDGARWERRATAGPPARVHHAMQYDPDAQRVVLFGGFAPNGPTFGDTWTWDGTTWTESGDPATPHSHARMAYHRRLQRLLLAGAQGGSSPTLSLLARNGTTWSPLATTGGPSARYLPDVAYDESRNVLVLFGGGNPAGTNLFADTWEFDGTTWRRAAG